MKCCEIVPGSLRHTITIERLARTTDNAGGWTDSWATLHTVKAAIKNVSGSERLHSMRLDAEVTMKATIRYLSDLKEADRVVFRGKRYQIRHIDNVEFRDRWLILSLDGGVAT